jgi:hypothetical protein
VTALLAIGQGAIFGIGTVIVFVVFTAALSLAYLRFDELGEDE